MKKLLLILIIAIFFSISFLSCSNLEAQSEGHNIEVLINNFNPKDKTKTYFLARYYGNSHYKADSSKLINGNKLVFKSDTVSLTPSYYKLLLDDTVFVELIIQDDQEFSLSFDYNNVSKSVEIKGDKQNMKLYEYFSFLETKRKSFENNKNENISEEEQKKYFENQLAEINKWREDYIKSNPNNLLALTFKAIKEKKFFFQENTDPVKQKQMFDELLETYFDEIPFENNSLYGIPAMLNKIDYFFDNLMLNIDIAEIPNYAISFIEKNKKNKKNFEFALGYLISKYEQGNYMFSKDVYSELAIKYVNKKNMPWLDEAQVYRIVDRATKYKNITLGKKATIFNLKNQNGEYKNLYNINAKTTILMFFNSECSHCKDAAPFLVNFNKDNKDLYDFKIVTINVGDDKEKWLEFIKEQKFDDLINLEDTEVKSNIRMDYVIESVPKIFLLNEEKEIMAKDVAPESLKTIYNRLVLGKNEKQNNK